MKLTIQIEMDNAAFEENFNEAGDILIGMYQTLEDFAPLRITDGEWLRDSNGNIVGAWRVS